MKQFSFFFFLGVFVSNLFAQKTSWLSEDMQWSVLVESETALDYRQEWTEFTFLKSDTIIDGFVYQKIYTSESEDLFETKWSGLCIRQDGDKVYHYDTFLEKEFLLLDFSKEKRDVFTYYNGLTARVEEEYKMEMKDGTICRCLQIWTSEGSDVWVEGLGSLNFGIGKPYKQRKELCHRVLCCHNKGRLIYQTPYYNTCYRKVHLPFSLVNDHVKWTEIHGSSDEGVPDKFDICDYEVLGDTLFENRSYKKVYLSVNKSVPIFYVGIREEDRTVYCIRKEDEVYKEYKLYDFDWMYADSLQLVSSDGENYQFKCEVNGVIESEDGNAYDYIQLDNDWKNVSAPSTDVRLIRNLGSTLGVFAYLFGNENKEGHHLYSEVTIVRYDDRLIYRNPHYSEEGLFLPTPEGFWLTEGTKWTEIRYREGGWLGTPYSNPTRYELKTGGYIDGHYYWRLWANEFEIGKMREDEEGNIYVKDWQSYRNSWPLPEFVLYSFPKIPWVVGDMIRYAMPAYLAGGDSRDGVVVKESVISHLSKVTLENGESVPIYNSIIYGVGDIGGLFTVLLPSPTDGSRAGLYDFYRNGELLYLNKTVGIPSIESTQKLTLRNDGKNVVFTVLDAGNYSIHIYEVSGQNLGRFLLENGEARVGCLPRGIYMYQLISGTNEIVGSGKFVIWKE